MKSKKYVLNYKVDLKPDRRIGSNEPCFVASCPTLGLVDDGETKKEALRNIKKTIVFHLECFKKEGKEIPTRDLPKGILRAILR